MPLIVRRNDKETWREAVERYASRHGLQEECLSDFDQLTAAEIDGEEAAWMTLYDWDVLDYDRDHAPRSSE